MSGYKIGWMDGCECLGMNPSETESNPETFWRLKPTPFSSKLLSTEKCNFAVVVF